MIVSLASQQSVDFYQKKHRVRRLCVLFVSLMSLLPSSAWATKVYQQPDDFLREVMPSASPKVLTLTTPIKSRINALNGGNYRPSRMRYWKEGTRTVWILEEIGKTLPITVGYVVDKGKISQVKVLIYRESHGYEVSYTYFTKRFRKMYLKKGEKLNKRISNIAGATLSVRAMTKMARVALLLDQQVQ